ncbi:hypothetical protein NQ314_016005, partial [Rhamnusium bicolor]
LQSDSDMNRGRVMVNLVLSKVSSEQDIENIASLSPLLATENDIMSLKENSDESLFKNDLFVHTAPGEHNPHHVKILASTSENPQSDYAKSRPSNSHVEEVDLGSSSYQENLSDGSNIKKTKSPIGLTFGKHFTQDSIPEPESNTEEEPESNCSSDLKEPFPGSDSSDYVPSDDDSTESSNENQENIGEGRNSETEMDGANIEDGRKRKRKSKGQSDPSQWKRQKNAKLRLKGNEYQGFKKNSSGKYQQILSRKKRFFETSLPGSCINNCY